MKDSVTNVVLLSVVVPCFNEAKRLPESVSRIAASVRKSKVPLEIVVVDDGSTDETASIAWHELAVGFRITYIRSGTNEGKGAALRRGIESAVGQYILLVDADLSVDLAFLPMAMNLITQEGISAIVGDRRLPGSVVIGESPKRRVIVSALFNAWVQMLVLPGITDTQCPFKLFRTEVLHRVIKLTRLRSFAFDVEVLYHYIKHGLQVARIPVCWFDTRKKLPYLELMGVLLRCSWEVLRLRVTDLRASHPVPADTAAESRQSCK